MYDTQGVIKEIFQNTDFQGRCDLSPGPIEHNEQVITPWTYEYPLRLFDGDFLQLHAVTRVEEVLQVTGDQTGSDLHEFTNMGDIYNEQLATFLDGVFIRFA